MDQVLIVETRDPLEHKDAERIATLAGGLAAEGCRATVFLTENAVIAARPGVAPFLEALAGRNVAVEVDRVALAERGLAESEMARGMTASGIERVVDALLAGAGTMWR